MFESNILILCGNTTSIDLSKNPIIHSHAKHMEIKNNFIRDHVLKGIVEL